MQAYIAAPYNKILFTRAVISEIFTRTLEIPNILQLHLTALNVLFAAANLIYKSFSGETTLSNKYKPRYLNSLTFLISTPLTYIF